MDLSRYLPYLVNRLGQQFVADFSPRLAEHGQDIQSWRVLSVLQADGPLSAGELSDRTSINLSTLSRLTGRMEKRGLVRRRRDDVDARTVLVEITAEGQELFDALSPAAAALEQEALAALTVEEAEEVKRLLIKLHAREPAYADDHSLLIPSRFCGPSGSGHGGYTAGQLARYIGGPAEVTLKRPIPMDQRLTIKEDGDGIWLLHGEEEIAVAAPGRVDVDPIPSPGLEDAIAAESHFIADEDHLYPHCFVCGPSRAAGDGLRVFAGIPPGREYACASWHPDETLARDDGQVDDPFIWALLDCPAYFGMNLGEVFVLTGRMSVEIIDRPWAEEPYIVAGWKTGQEGRKHFAASAIYDTRGNVMAKSASTWIEPRRAG